MRLLVVLVLLLLLVLVLVLQRSAGQCYVHIVCRPQQDRPRQRWLSRASMYDQSVLQHHRVWRY